jgi:hypothetical protein
MPVHVTIDELVLIGFDRRDADAMSRAIEQAIAEHLDVPSLRAHATHTHVSRLMASDVTTPRGMHRADVGSSIGSAVARSITGVENHGAMPATENTERKK